MQLRRRDKRALGSRDVAAALTTATCALLGTGAPSAVLAQDIGQWQVDTAGLYYSESGRVSDMSFNALARTQPLEDRYLNLTFSFDSLSGASPNGAAPSASAQKFPRPITLTRTSGGGTVQSGGGSFTVAPGELPLDNSFQDMRYAGSANWQRPLGRLGIVDFGGGVSVEHDYTHLGLDTHVARDFNDRNTTLSGGVAWSDDTVDPIGGVPVPFSPLERSSGLGWTQTSQPKHVLDLLVGVTQVLGRRTIAQLNLSRSQSDGYLTDPYKIVSVVDPVTGDLAPGADPGIGLYLYENRPSSRTKDSLFGMLKHDFGGNVLDASYRVMTDDWGVDSHTLDMHFRWRFSPDKFLEPHVRFYSQTAARFYHTVLFAGEPIPQYATADYRLADMSSVTLGLEFGAKTSHGQFGARLEVYRQAAKPSPDALVGSLRGLDLTPDMTALIAQITYKFGW
ncbi:MAG TPA: DUF3570 domain-containing protein [Gammaproteobacteria bacterium]|nr:DUF3570 domain-containing protein [Gammaproteobacteria bacterium]